MRMQNSQANCGPTALHNALQALGIRRSPEECEMLCKCTATLGTYTTDLVAAIDSIKGCKPRVINNKGQLISMYMVTEALHQGRSVIMCVDDNEHYIAAIGMIGNRVLVCDSAENDLVISYKILKLERRWAPDYWGVIL